MSLEMQVSSFPAGGHPDMGSFGVRNPPCKEMSDAIQNALRGAQQAKEGDYSALLPMLIRKREEDRREGSQSKGITASGIVFLSLLSGDTADVRRYLPMMEEDLLNYGASRKLSLPGLPELAQAESPVTDPGFGAVSLSSFYHLSLTPRDSESTAVAMQLLLSAKDRELDDARLSLALLKDASSGANADLAGRLRKEYQSDSWEWWQETYKPSNHGVLPVERERAAAMRMQTLEKELQSKVPEYARASARPMAPRTAEVQAKLGDADALIEFAEVWWPDYHPERRPTFSLHPTAAEVHYVAYVLRHNAVRGVDLGPALKINQAILEYRSCMNPNLICLDWMKPARQLYQILW